MADLPQFLNPGTRTTVAGKTGSGKSTAAAFMLSKSRQRWVIIDPKRDDKIALLKPTYVEELNRAAVARAWKKSQYVSVLPPRGAGPDDIDFFMGDIFENYGNIGIGVDELYFIHNQGRAGASLTAILTRGRSEKVTFLGCTQRPAWISLFCLSEADEICQFRLQLENDRKRIFSVTGRPESLYNPAGKHDWMRYISAEDRMIKYWSK